MKKNKKLQAFMEFLMTIVFHYGWATLVILVTISALVYVKRNL